MVRTSPHSNRSGFTMIELIFAIVIIAISVMSLPMMTQVTSKGIENSLTQEAIFASAAELMGVTAGYWDGNSMDDSALSSLSRVIDIENMCDATTRLKPGHINQPFHRRCLDNNGTIIGAADNNPVAGVNALIEQASHDIFLNLANTQAAGYKKKYTSTIDVNRTAANIKIITSTIRDKDSGDLITILKTQSANIGEIDYFKKTFQ